MLLAQPPGNYRFLAGDGHLPFCDAVVADPGYEIVRAQLDRPLPWREGFALAERHLAGLGRPKQALCAVELRCAEPYAPEAFAEFNRGYADLLRDWGLFVGDLGSTTRTNVAPEHEAPTEQVMFAFAYTVPAPDARPTFVISGAPEDDDVRPGETSPDALRAKTANVRDILAARLAAIDQAWPAVTQIAVYAPHDHALAAVRAELLPHLGPAVLNGLRWFPSWPPIVGYEIEIDCRGLRTEIRL